MKSKNQLREIKYALQVLNKLDFDVQETNLGGEQYTLYESFLRCWLCELYHRRYPISKAAKIIDRGRKYYKLLNRTPPRLITN